MIKMRFVSGYDIGLVYVRLHGVKELFVPAVECEYKWCAVSSIHNNTLCAVYLLEPAWIASRIASLSIVCIPIVAIFNWIEQVGDKRLTLVFCTHKTKNRSLARPSTAYTLVHTFKHLYALPLPFVCFSSALCANCISFHHVIACAIIIIFIGVVVVVVVIKCIRGNMFT